jgi:integrase
MTDVFRPVAAACALGGLRASEALGLRWRDVDFHASTLTVSGQLGDDGTRVPTKTRASEATVPLLPALVRELRAHRMRQGSRDLRLVHADSLVFTTARGKPQSRRNALRAVHAAGDAAGLNPNGRQSVGLHDLRHSYVALALATGLSLAETAALARHANARVTAQVYAGLADDGCEAAAAKLVEAGFGR